MNTPCHIPGPSLRRMAVLAALLAALFLVAGADSKARSKSPPPAASVGATASVPDEAKAPAASGEAAEAGPGNRDAEYRSLAVGTWQDDYRGKRTMHLLEDGTGTMIVELSGLTAALFASRLEFDMVWSIEDGRMKKQTVSGRPAAKVKAILTMMGDRVDEPILESTGARLVLLDADGKTRYDWRRVEED